MTKRIVFILSFILTALPLSALETLDPSGIRPGMTGYGLTVFRGWEPEKFDVKIIDVMKGVFVQGDLILAELSGHDLETTGVIAGMSGSPVYIDGKLIGAVAYTWAFGKKPVCGITPIGMMLSERDNSIPDFYDDRGLIRRIASPVSVRGLCPEAVRYLEGVYSNQGLVFNSAGGGTSPGTPPEGMNPGDAVSVKLIEGDIDMSVTGTVTFVSNGDVFIFGHPLYQIGDISFPMSRSYIYTVIPSMNASFKLGGSSTTVGTAVFDGRSAVYCKMGTAPHMIPVTVNVATANTNGTYRFKVIRHKVYAAYLASSAISSAVSARSGLWQDQTIAMKLRIDCTYNGTHYVLSNSFRYVITPMTYSVALMLGDVAGYLNAVLNNAFGEIFIDNLTVDAQVTRDTSFYTLVSATMDKAQYYAGEKAVVTVVLKKYRGDYATRTLTVALPDRVISGSYKAYIGSQFELDSQVAGLFPYVYTINGMDDLVRAANEPSDMYKLQALFVGFNEGIVYQREALPDFPEPYISILGIRPDPAKNYAFPEITGTDLELDAPVFGNTALQFTLLTSAPQEVDAK